MPLVAILVAAGLAALVATRLGRQERRTVLSEADTDALLEAIGLGAIVEAQCGSAIRQAVIDVAESDLATVAETDFPAQIAILRQHAAVQCPAVAEVSVADAIEAGATEVTANYGSLEAWLDSLHAIAEGRVADYDAAAAELAAILTNFRSACAGEPTAASVQEAAWLAFERAAAAASDGWQGVEAALDVLENSGLRCWTDTGVATGARNPDRWHYVDRWVRTARGWREQEYLPGKSRDMFYGHPMVAFREYELANFPKGSPDVIARCLFYDGRGWQPCEWS